MAKNTPDDEVKEKKRTKLADRLLQIGKDCAAHLKEPSQSEDLGAVLYNDQGLPHPGR